MRVGLSLSTEEYGPADLIEQARLAEEAGFHALWISDHYHPWNGDQGESPFVWSLVGALSTVCRLPVTTAVTCPTARIHPAIIAQAAATSAVMHAGRFTLGVGTGEALNEHILGGGWPEMDVRLAWLEEAVEIIRKLWSGRQVSYRGRYFTVENAQLCTLPETPPKIYVSAFGPRSLEVAARIGDGYISVKPDANLVSEFRATAGKDKPCQAGFKACYARAEEQAVDLAHRLWPNAGIPGELSQLLPSPAHFEQVRPLVPREIIRKSYACGPDPQRQLEQIQLFVEAGYDEVYVAPIGPHYSELIDLYRTEVLPQIGS
jgi:G6PDH family F420-dependent oxidoreductase